jgi:hypothetical protein
MRKRRNVRLERHVKMMSLAGMNDALREQLERNIGVKPKNKHRAKKAEGKKDG